MRSSWTGWFPACGNLNVRRQQFWLGPRMAGQTVRIWIDTTTAHVSVHGQHWKTLPSRLSSLDLDKLRADGARPAGPPPARPAAAHLAAGAPVEIHRVVNASGNVSVAGRHVSVGAQWAGRRIALRLEHQLAHVIIDGALMRTPALSLHPRQRARLQGARAAGSRPLPDRRPTRVQRRVSDSGCCNVIGQRIQVGLRHAGRIVTIEVDDTMLRAYDDHDELIASAPRTSSNEVKRHKAFGRKRAGAASAHLESLAESLETHQESV